MKDRIPTPHPNSKYKGVKNEPVVCFSCGKPGHIKRYFPANISVIESSGTPLFNAYINGHCVPVLCDTGFGVGFVVHHSIVKESDYTREFQTITLVNVVKDKVTIVMVDIHSKYVCGCIQIVCLVN